MAFSIVMPAKILFGRGGARQVKQHLTAFGAKGLVVYGAKSDRISWLFDELQAFEISLISCPSEPSLAMLQAALAQGLSPDWVLAIGGGSAIDMGKALAALIPAKGDVMRHLEVVGQGLPLDHQPLPFVALPTTSGTGAEATKNAVISLPEHGRKVSIRDERMLPNLAIVDPALTDHSPKAVTLASGLDALTQVIEPLISSKATLYTDTITRPLIKSGLLALKSLMEHESAEARDHMSWLSVMGGIALANSGLGAVHGLAGVIGGRLGAPHGAICGNLLAPILIENARDVKSDKIAFVFDQISDVFQCDTSKAPEALHNWVRRSGLPSLNDLGLKAQDHRMIATEALQSSSMKGNPCPLSVESLERALRMAH